MINIKIDKAVGVHRLIVLTVERGTKYSMIDA